MKPRGFVARSAGRPMASQITAARHGLPPQRPVMPREFAKAFRLTETASARPAVGSTADRAGSFVTAAVSWLASSREDVTVDSFGTYE